MTRSSPSRASKRDTRSSARTPTPSSNGQTTNPYALNPNPEIVDPVWLIKVLALVVIGAMLCGYLTLCALFYQAQWQFALHPVHGGPPPALSGNTHLESVRFGADESGTPQIAGWWLPTDPGARYATATVLYLPSGDGSLADSAATLAALHATGINVFAFDYRGYGQSAPTRPNQQRMEQDARSAWRLLTETRGLPPSSIVPFGDGVGAALAVQLAQQHSEIAAVVVRTPVPDVLARVLRDPRTRLLPVHLLFHDRFEISQALSALHTPKLLIAGPSGGELVTALYRQAADPKFTLYLPASASPDSLSANLPRFLDQYLSGPR